MDPDLINAWQFAGGSAEKGGKVSIRRLQEAADQYQFNIRIDKILEAHQLKKLANQLSQQNKKPQIMEEIDFEEFTNRFGNDNVEKLPSWVFE